MDTFLGDYNISSLQSIRNRISDYIKTIEAYQNGLGISEREYHLAVVKRDCLMAQKQYLEYLNEKNGFKI